jgi:hypothetical protein
MQRSTLPGSLQANPMPQEWNIALYLALFALFVVFVRRMMRVKSVMRENLKDFREPKFPSMRGHGGGRHG